ncbi:MAG: GHKL domain-containing protein [Herbinix sp.]|nr:GHKL domain-containing protein [Herbinix sp.]
MIKILNSFNFVIQYMPCVIECFILLRLMSSVLDLKYNKTVPIVIAAVMFFLINLKHIIFQIPGLERYQVVGVIILLAFTFFSFHFLYKNTLKEKLIWWGVFYLGIIGMELVTILVLSLIMENPLEVLASNNPMSFWIIFIGKLMTLLVFEIIIRKHNGHMVIGISYFKELAIIILFNFVLMLGVVFTYFNRHDIGNNINHILIFAFGVVLLITGYTVVLIFRIEKKSNEEMATQLKLQQIELELKLNKDMISIMDKLRILRHDMNNHIGLIKTLVYSQKYDELEEYINQIYEDVEVANDLVITGNQTLSVLLNAKKSLAKEKDIEFTSIIATQEISMQNKDICSLLGNILDNAIEAAEKSGEKKYIQLMIQNTQKGCVISCENSFGVKPVMKKGRFITNKDNALIHGIGTENIKDIVSKYNGEIMFDFDDDIFNVRVVMPI